MTATQIDVAELVARVQAPQDRADLDDLDPSGQ